MTHIKQVFKDVKGWREVNPFPEGKIVHGFPHTQEWVPNYEHNEFERKITYYEFPNAPNVKPGEVVMAYLQWQWLMPCTKNNWRNCQSPIESPKYKDMTTRQIWVAANQSNQEGKEEQPPKNQPEPPVDADYINKLTANLNTLQEVCAEDLVGVFRNFIKGYPLTWLNCSERMRNILLKDAQQYATLKTSSLQQENDKLRDQVRILRSTLEEIAIIADNALNKKP